MRGHALTGRTAYLEMDQGTGALRVGGHLTVQGADLLRGAVLALQGRGHDRVTLDLEGVQSVDDAGLRALLTLQETVTMDGGELVLLHTARAAPVGSSSRAAPTHGQGGRRW
jgi:anti-anti-sigma factor